MKKNLLLLLSLLLVVTAGCGHAPEAQLAALPTAIQTAAPTPEPLTFSILNPEPALSVPLAALLAEYQAETGVIITVDEKTPSATAQKPPVQAIFPLSNMADAGAYDSCLDLRDSGVYELLTKKEIALTGSGGSIYGIPYSITGYGILYNNAILEKYHSLPGAVVSSMDQVNSFAAFESLVLDMQEKSHLLGIQGVFASTSLSPDSRGRWEHDLLNITLSHEPEGERSFLYGDQMKNLFDLYLNNACTQVSRLQAKTEENSMEEFAQGRCAMVQCTSLDGEKIKGVSFNTVLDEDFRFLPIYMGIPGEEARGLAISVTGYFAVNSGLSPETQQAALAFLHWLYTSSAGRQFVNTYCDAAPFPQLEPIDPLSREVSFYLATNSKTPVSCLFEASAAALGDALAAYAKGDGDWAAVNAIVTEHLALR